MSEPLPLVPEFVSSDWLAALRAREPRALELAYSLALTLAETAETRAFLANTRAAWDGGNADVSEEVRERLNDEYRKYDALREGDFVPVDLSNPNIVAFERRTRDERLLLIHNLARVSQPIRFREYAETPGWDILNRVEFMFPAGALLEAHEFLWLMIN